MTPDLFDNLSILIVEDETLGDGFAQDLRDYFSNAKVDRGWTHQEGMDRVRSRADEPYNVAFLDFFLPELTEAGEKTIDTAILTVLPLKTIVIHISAYGEDSAKVKPLLEAWENRPQRPFHFVTKGDGFTRRAVQEMKSAIATSYFRTRREELFSAEGTSAQLPWTRNAPSSARNDALQSYELTEFYVDAAEYWDFLAEDFRGELKQAFGFAMIDGKPCLGVVTREQALGPKSKEEAR
jgi:hypothetical protein